MINYFFKRLRAVSIAFLIAFSMPSFSATTIMSSTDIYLRDNSGSIQYSLDQSNWTSIATFPVSLINSGVTDINVRFISNYSGPDIEYFETASEGLNFLYSYSGIPIKSRDGYTINLINNSATIHSDFSKAILNRDGSVIIDLINSGTLSSTTDDGVHNGSLSTITKFNNSGTISGDTAIYNEGTISILNNSSTGTISGGDAIHNNGTITNLINSGTISNTNRVGIYNLRSITSLTNSVGGVISDDGSKGAIFNDPTASIVTFNNAQGGDSLSASKTAIVYNGKLPTNYNIIIASPSNYGQLAWTNKNSGSVAAESTNFGIYSGGVDGVVASTVSKGTYTAVLSNLTTSNIGSTRSGIYSGLNWTLALQSGSSSIWDLIFTGGSTVDTQSSLASHARRLRGAFNSSVASSNFANMNTYDCNLFDQNNMCISAGGRYTNIDNPNSNNSAAVVVLGYKVSPNIRIGGFLDQSVNNNTPTGVHLSNSNPMMGAFAVWNQNANGLGYQVKIANAYQDKDVTTTRDIINTSEAGTGKTNLNTQSYVGELSYAFNYQDSTLVSPYFALRYTNIKQDAYTEELTSSVTAPLSYAKLGDRSTTALMGVKLNHALTPKTNLTASLGIEQDINHQVDKLTASGVADLTSENFNNNIKRTRPVASAGAYYAVTKTQRLSGEVYYQQLPFQSTGSATAYVNYMIGF